MIRLGLRLTFGSGREAALRVLVTAAAVALGVGLLLACLAGVNGLHAQTDRGAWLDTSAQASGPTSTTNSLWWLSSTDQFDNQEIDRIDVAATRADAPVPPGIPHLPGRGEYYASPALTTLLGSEPVSELSDRYQGRQIGTIGAAALPSPNSLIIVIGHTARQLSEVPGAVEVASIQRTPANCYACQSTVGSGSVLQFILVGGAVALLLPVLILIATASRLSAARREERFAAMRLVGATPRQISVVSAVEAVVAAVAGVAVGFALFFVFRPLLYHVPFTGAPLAQGDLSLHLTDMLLVVIGVPVAAIVSSRLALRRVQESPLGVKRRATSHPPRIVRIIPLLAGIAVLAYFDSAGKPGAVGGQLLELLVGFVLLVVGLVLAGPWFTTAGSRLMTKRANRPATLIAGRRLLDNPKAAFRFISGLVIALFVASALIGALSSISASASNSGGGDTGEFHPRRPVLQFLYDQLSGIRPSAFRPVPCAGRTSHDSWSARCDGGPPGPVPSWFRQIIRGRPVRPTGGDARHRQMRSGSDGGECRLLLFAPPWAPITRVNDGLAVGSAVSGGGRASSRRCHRRRNRRVIWLTGTGTYRARTGISLPGNADRSRCARSIDRPTPRNDPGHDRRDHRGQPHHCRLQSGGEHRRRIGRAQAPVQFAQAHRRPYRRPAPGRRAGECDAAPRCGRSFDRGRPRVSCPLPPLPGRHRVPSPGHGVTGPPCSGDWWRHSRSSPRRSRSSTG